MVIERTDVGLNKSVAINPIVGDTEVVGDTEEGIKNVAKNVHGEISEGFQKNQSVLSDLVELVPVVDGFSSPEKIKERFLAVADVDKLFFVVAGDLGWEKYNEQDRVVFYSPSGKLSISQRIQSGNCFYEVDGDINELFQIVFRKVTN